MTQISRFIARLVEDPRIVAFRVGSSHIGAVMAMTTPNRTDDDRAELARFLREAIEADRYPFSPRVRRLKGAAGEDRPDARVGRGAG